MKAYNQIFESIKQAAAGATLGALIGLVSCERRKICDLKWLR